MCIYLCNTPNYAELIKKNSGQKSIFLLSIEKQFVEVKFLFTIL